MRDACYIVADEFGIVRMTKRQPSLKRGERGVKVIVSIPDTAFTAFPVAQLSISEAQILHPVEVDVEEP